MCWSVKHGCILPKTGPGGNITSFTSDTGSKHSLTSPENKKARKLPRVKKKINKAKNVYHICLTLKQWERKNKSGSRLVHLCPEHMRFLMSSMHWPVSDLSILSEEGMSSSSGVLSHFLHNLHMPQPTTFLLQCSKPSRVTSSVYLVLSLKELGISSLAHTKM